MPDALVIGFYACLAALAAYATWANDELRPVGLALIASCAVSNVAHAYVGEASQPGIYTMLEIIVATTAYVAFAQSFRRLMICVVVAALLSICANIGFAAIIHPNRMQKFTWEVATNCLFAIECIFAMIAGVRDGVGAGRFDHWLGRRGHAPEPHAYLEGREP